MDENKKKKKPRLAEQQKKQRGAGALADPEKPVSRKFSPGMIKHVSLVDFTVHSSLELDLDPTVNIITGRNGSGKSSIIQAIVLGLGGGAKDTKRSQHLPDFIKRDATRAEIRLHVDNSGDLAYRPEKFGAVIVFERILTRAGNGSHSLKSESGQQVYHGADAIKEKASILKHCCIQMDNPLTFLHQEDAKSFFCLNKKSSLYEYTMAATTLSQAQATYAKAQAEIVATKETMAKHEALSKKKTIEYQRLLTQLSELQSCGPNADAESNKLEAEKIFHFVYVYERKLKNQEADLSAAIGLRTDLEQKLTKQQEELSDRAYRLEEIQMEQREREEKLALLREEFEKSESRYKQKDIEIIKAISHIERLKWDLSVLKQKEQCAINEINSEKKRFEEMRLSGATSRREAVEASIARLEQERAESHETERSLRIALGTLQDHSPNIKVLKKTKAKLEASISKLDADMAMVGQSESSDLDSFGSDVASFADIVQNESGFLKRPIGPIGQYIVLTEKAKSDKLGHLLESFLDRDFLRSFIVDNRDDFDRMFDMMKAHFGPNVKPPDIIECSFRNERLDISPGRFPSTPERPTVLDYLRFTNDEVFKAAIMYKHVESTLIITEEEAELLFEKKENVPPKATCAITPNFYKYYPAGSRRDYFATYIERQLGPSRLATSAQSSMAAMQEQKACLEKELQKQTDALTAMEAEQAEMERKKTTCVLELTRHMEAQNKMLINLTREHLSLEDIKSEAKGTAALEQQYNALVDQQAEVKREFEERVQNRARLKRELGDLNEQREEAKRKLAEEQRDRGTDELALLQAEVKRLQDLVAKRKRGLNDNEKKTTEMEKQCAETRKKLEKTRALALLRNNNQEMPNPRPLDEIEAVQKARERARDARMRELGGSVEDLTAKFEELEQELLELKEGIAESGKNLQLAEQMHAARKDCLEEQKNRIGRDISRRFSMVFSTQSMIGRVKMDHQLRTMDLLVGHVDQAEAGAGGDEASRKPQPLANLSGGERSKTLSIFMLALWEHVWTPFRCLDEWDVYLDPVVRSEIENKLYSHAVSSRQQFLFISPHGSTIRGAKIIEIERPET